jgi:antitoxin MazE
MRAPIISIGNSKGIRIPKSILEQCGFQNTVTIEVIDHNLLIKAADSSRQGWKEMFSLESSRPQDFSDVQAFANEWDDEEWQW